MTERLLQYEPSREARPVLVEHDGDIQRIIVPMPGVYAPVPRWTADLDFLSLIVMPVWWLLSLLIHRFFVPPPRAVFEITSEKLRVVFHEPQSGEEFVQEWPRSAVVEARANQWCAGLWLHVAGHIKETFLEDLPQESIAHLEAALQQALGLSAKP